MAAFEDETGSPRYRKRAWKAGAEKTPKISESPSETKEDARCS